MKKIAVLPRLRFALKYRNENKDKESRPRLTRYRSRLN